MPPAALLAVAGRAYYSAMSARGVLLVVAVVVLMVVSGLAFPALHNPAVILLVAMLTLGLTLVKDRRAAIGLAMAASVALAFLAWVASQPRYL